MWLNLSQTCCYVNMSCYVSMTSSSSSFVDLMEMNMAVRRYTVDFKPKSLDVFNAHVWVCVSNIYCIFVLRMFFCSAGVKIVLGSTCSFFFSFPFFFGLFWIFQLFSIAISVLIKDFISSSLEFSFF